MKDKTYNLVFCLLGRSAFVGGSPEMSCLKNIFLFWEGVSAMHKIIYKILFGMKNQEGGGVFSVREAFLFNHSLVWFCPFCKLVSLNVNLC